MGEFDPLPNHVLALDVLRMGFSGEYELDRAFVIRKNSKETIGIMQEKIGALVRRKTTGETQCQSVGIEHRAACAISSGEAPRPANCRT